MVSHKATIAWEAFKPFQGLEDHPGLETALMAVMRMKCSGALGTEFLQKALGTEFHGFLPNYTFLCGIQVWVGPGPGSCVGVDGGGRCCFLGPTRWDFYFILF